MCTKRTRVVYLYIRFGIANNQPVGNEQNETMALSVEAAGAVMQEIWEIQVKQGNEHERYGDTTDLINNYLHVVAITSFFLIVCTLSYWTERMFIADKERFIKFFW